MKRPLALFYITLLLWAPVSKAGNHDKAAQKSQVSIFEVAWQCPAAPAIGCGSHAKPLLLQLQADPSVREAWLNRQGTMVAVVWNSDVKKKARREVAKTLKEQEATKVSGDKEAKALADFNSGKGWYRGADVDRLSEEEARVIGTRWVRRLQAKTTLPKDKAAGLESALADALKNVLTGKIAKPDEAEARAAELRRVAGPYLDEAQLKILAEAAQSGMRPMPNEE